MANTYASVPQTIENGKGITFKYWTTLESDEYMDIPTLNGRIDLADTVNKSWDGKKELRVGVEIGDTSNWFKWRDQNTFFGSIPDKKMSEAYIGRKFISQGYELFDYRAWCLNPKTSYKFVKGSWNSGIKISDTVNTIDSAAKTASFEFKRPLVTLYSETMDLIPNEDYYIYLSYGVFNSAGDATKSKVVGAIRKGYNFEPNAVAFKLLSDAKTPKSVNSGATMVSVGSALAVAAASLI